MSDARERLLQGEYGKDAPSQITERTGEFLDYFLAHPYDLLAVLVEAGVLRLIDDDLSTDLFLYRRIEGDKR